MSKYCQSQYELRFSYVRIAVACTPRHYFDFNNLPISNLKESVHALTTPDRFRNRKTNIKLDWSVQILFSPKCEFNRVALHLCNI